MGQRFGPCLVFVSSNFLCRCGFCLLFYSIRMLSYVVKRYKEQYFIDCFSLFWDHFVLTFILNILPCWSSLFPCMAESGKGSCISPVSMGNVITWRCSLQILLIIDNFIVLALSWTQLSILHWLNYLLLITHPWSLVLMSSSYNGNLWFRDIALSSS